ncbi:cysteine desulfurase family protein [Streptococcus ovuberis]|uniref:cysteine desulfurase n=1 Tax=Streptococcus ovuberis TaxID=1936207 RepID=A0A7X6MZZ7_9STRE|nr:cysteine desulfurase family protein [Streptococcus ovuberis]NKZ20918.1 cysteine desulfurase [Streptococcus ovuberis]
MIYLDNAATTPLSQLALDKLYQVSRDYYGNPSSLHGHGRKAAQILRQARQAIANALKTNPNRLIFTSGGTEAITLAIKGYALAQQKMGKHLITTTIEHHAVLHTVEALVRDYGFEVTYLSPKNGQISAQDVETALRPDTILVSVMHTNNETGYQLPIKEIAELLRSHPARLHVDAVQAIGKVPIYPEEEGIDFLSASGHKFHGPKGVGFLYTNTNQLKPVLVGGNQEDKRRASTENLASIAAMAEALGESLIAWQESFAHVNQRKQDLLAGLEASNLPYYLNQQEPASPYIVNIGFPNQLNERLLMQLDLAGISVSSGSACTAGNIEPSHVLEAFYGSSSLRLKESIRVSFSSHTSFEDVQTFIKTLTNLLGG